MGGLRQLKARGWWKELPPRGRSGAPLIPRIPTERGVLDLFPLVPDGAEPSAHRETLSAHPCVSWCECVALVRHLVKLQEACDAKANDRGRGVMNTMDVVEKKNGPRKSRKYRSHLAWMTAVRDQVAVVETDNMADLVLSQGGTTIASLGRRCSSPLVALRCSNLVRARVLPPGGGDLDMVNAMTNLVVQAVRKRDLPSWLLSRELSSWSEHADHTTATHGRLQGFLGAKAVILGVAHASAVRDIEHAESARWLRALSMESRLLRWIACSDFGLFHDWFIESKKPWPENSTFACWWQTIEDRVLLCVEEVARASTSSHLSCHFDGFMVHRDVPPVTSSQQFLDDLARHLRTTTSFTIPFDLKKHFSFTQLLVRTGGHM